MSRELRELRRIRQQLEKSNGINSDNPTNKNIDDFGNNFIKFILISGVIILFVFLILLAIVMY